MSYARPICAVVSLTAEFKSTNASEGGITRSSNPDRNAIAAAT